jgi:beta-lactamase regulating signal transducer with metallopeptidase domain
MADLIADLGRDSASWLWTPLVAWTAGASAVLLVLRLLPALHPLAGYRVSQGLLLSLPFTILVGPKLSAFVPGPAWPVPLDRPGPSGLLLRGVEAGPIANGTPSASPEVLGVLLGVGTLLFLLVGAVHVGVFATHLRSIRRIRALARRSSDPWVETRLRSLAPRLGVTRPVEVLAGPQGTIPFTFGLARPTIVLDAELKLTQAQLDMALAHELIHVRRHDAWWALFEGLVAAAGAAHPLVRMLSKTVERLRESSCDAELVASGVAPPRAYAELLLHLGPRTPVRLPVAGLAARPSNLKRRLMNMKRFALTPTSRWNRPASTAMGFVSFLSIIALGACGGRSEPPPSPDIDVAEQLTSQFGPMADETREAALERLDVQMAYLTERVEDVAAQISAAQADGRDPQPHVWEQYQLLSRMYLQRLETYETLKLERETEIRLNRSVRPQDGG